MSHRVMCHIETGHLAEIAESAVPHAVARGWELVEPDQPAPVPDPSAQEPAPPAEQE